MIRRALLLGMLLGLAGCATTPEVQILFGPRRAAGQEGLGAVLIVTQKVGHSNAICGYLHSSEPTKGRPFNDEHDVSVDLAGCGLKWGGERK